MNLQQITYDICRYYLKSLTNSELSSTEIDMISGWLRSRCVENLASVSKVLPNAQQSVGRYRALLQIEGFFKKNSIFENPTAESVAVSNFVRAENHCRTTNTRLQEHIVLAHEDLTIIRCIRRNIARVLGDFELFVNQLPSLGYITRGATVDLGRRKAAVHNKLGVRKKITCTPGCSELVKKLANHWGYKHLQLKEVQGNRVAFVPKNWKTRRTIACEPVGNMFLQLAFDQYAKVQLRKHFSIDLSDQSYNQRLARAGSLGNHLVTIDLEMASDTLSHETVRQLLPEKWYQFLDSVRSHRYTALNQKGDLIMEGEYHKFSSMGNGATFALETLIFAAICRPFVKLNQPFSVYGDDIIIPREAFESAQKWLTHYGFILNNEKTFSEGPFRESCGVNYYEGVDITPKRITWDVRGKPGLCHIVNSLGAVSYATPLAELLEYLVHQHELPFVPGSEVTTAGIWEDPMSSRIKMLHTSRVYGPWIPCYTAYVQKTKAEVVGDSRTLFHWFLQTRGRKVLDGYVCTSNSAVPSNRYDRGLVKYRPDTKPWVDTFSGWSSENIGLAHMS